MPAQKGKSALMAKYGQNIDKAARAHGADETDYGRIQVPAGIANGVAKLTRCYFDTYKTGKNQGEFYFRAVGVIESPKEVNGVPCYGLQTSIMEAVCQTSTQAGKTTTMEEHVASILNEMRKLGADTTGASGEQLEGIAAALEQAGPYFRFSTSVRKAQKEGDPDGVWENWHGVKGLEDYQPEGDAGTHVQDDTGGSDGDESNDGTAADASDESGPDLTAMVAAAYADETGKAGDKLKALAMEHGVDEAFIDAPKTTWEMVAEKIEEATLSGDGGEANDSEQGEQEFVPALEEVYKFGPTDPKTKKPMINPRTKKPLKVEVEVVKVDKKDKTVDLKNIDDGKTVYKAVPWDALEAG